MPGGNGSRQKLPIADAARIAFAVLLLIFVPTVGLMLLSDRLPPYEHTGWFLRALLALPATAACAALLWPPIWLVCRNGGESARFTAGMFALIYTPVFAFQLVGYFNVAFDREPGRSVTVRYVRREVRSKGPNLDVISSWNDADETIALRSTNLGKCAQSAGSPVRLTVHRGWLSAEWVDHVRCEEHQ